MILQHKESIDFLEKLNEFKDILQESGSLKEPTPFSEDDEVMFVAITDGYEIDNVYRQVIKLATKTYSHLYPTNDRLSKFLFEFLTLCLDNKG